MPHDNNSATETTAETRQGFGVFDLLTSSLLKSQRCWGHEPPWNHYIIIIKAKLKANSTSGKRRQFRRRLGRLQEQSVQEHYRFRYCASFKYKSSFALSSDTGRWYFLCERGRTICFYGISLSDNIRQFVRARSQWWPRRDVSPESAASPLHYGSLNQVSTDCFAVCFVK